MASDLDRRTLRTISCCIVPFIMLLYFIADIDRVDIGFASLTMNKHIGLSAAAFGLGAGILFFGYLLFEVPSSIILQRVGARIWIARVMISRRIISALLAYVQGEVSFYLLRFLLGVGEAGFFPGIIFYLGEWFPARHWMSLLEAVPAVILGFGVLVFMTDRPGMAKWLQADEREWLVAEMDREHALKGGKESHDPEAGLTGLRVLALALVCFGTSAGLYTLGVWAPQIIRRFGLSPVEIGFFNAVPPTVAVVAAAPNT